MRNALACSHPGGSGRMTKISSAPPYAVILAPQSKFKTLLLEPIELLIKHKWKDVGGKR